MAPYPYWVFEKKVVFLAIPLGDTLESIALV